LIECNFISRKSGLHYVPPPNYEPLTPEPDFAQYLIEVDLIEDELQPPIPVIKKEHYKKRVGIRSGESNFIG
jgi:hypothetical protein